MTNPFSITFSIEPANFIDRIQELNSVIKILKNYSLGNLMMLRISSIQFERFEF